jgi:hypothetical protein
MLVGLVLSLAAIVGCGGDAGKYVEGAPAAKPVSIGVPASIPDGVSTLTNSYFLVNTQVDGETRIWVLGNRVPVQSRDPLTWDEETQMFYSPKKQHRYDIQGNALHKMADGPRKGELAPPMDRYKVSIDTATGEVMLMERQSLKPDKRNLPDVGYVVAQ